MIYVTKLSRDVIRYHILILADFAVNTTNGMDINQSNVIIYIDYVCIAAAYLSPYRGTTRRYYCRILLYINYLIATCFGRTTIFMQKYIY
jgi:hypothetical protein